ncbi:hypothetical protein JFL47_11600 [Haemophilus haemoglobinophilus]|nr:hypothetical protein [Canicola haemoglobinophilus]MBN6711859.1 hypothetical protein [Canicola haemoglobinophilus]
MESLDIFEVACEYFSQKISEFTQILSGKVKILEKIDWLYNKGTIKVCQIDEKGKKKRCKTNLKYSSKVEIGSKDVEIIWCEFKAFFENTYTPNIERISANEEIGRYEFRATNSKGDSIRCMIYLSGEYNIPQVSISAFVTARYKTIDYER